MNIGETGELLKDFCKIVRWLFLWAWGNMEMLVTRDVRRMEGVGDVQIYKRHYEESDNGHVHIT